MSARRGLDVIVVEAIVEDESAKTDLFRRLDEIVQAPEAILASNTSSIPSMKLGVVTTRPTQVIGVHFFNPVPVLQLVELVLSLLTSDDTTARSRAWVQDGQGKQAIDCQDRAGFVQAMVRHRGQRREGSVARFIDHQHCESCFHLTLNAGSQPAWGLSAHVVEHVEHAAHDEGALVGAGRIPCAVVPVVV